MIAGEAGLDILFKPGPLCPLPGCALVHRHPERVALDGVIAGKDTQFLTALLVGINRFRRGELISAHTCIRGAALGHLLRLLAIVAPPERAGQLDSLDPHRRVEQAYPSLAAGFSSALTAALPAAARTLLELAEREVAPRLPHWPRRAAEVVAGVIAAAGR